MRTVLKEGEKLILEVKRHWIVLFIPFVVLVVAIIGLFVVTSYPSLAQWRFLGGVMIVAAPIYFLYKFYDREVDIWAVTNFRVIDEWGVFTRNTRESPLDRIHNVSYKQPLVGLLLGYGDVTIRTAAEHGDTTIEFATRPKELKDAIVRARAEFASDGRHESQEERRDENLVECPWCAELIKPRAKICRFCDRETMFDKAKEA